jgi:hypothetical protein
MDGKSAGPRIEPGRGGGNGSHCAVTVSGERNERSGQQKGSSSEYRWQRARRNIDQSRRDHAYSPTRGIHRMLDRLSNLGVCIYMITFSP